VNSCQYRNDKDALDARLFERQIAPCKYWMEISMTLEKKRIIILGGSSGIGLAVAKAAAQAGAELVIASSRKANIDRALAELPESAQGHTVDLGEEPRIRNLFEALGPFDHLVYTAGENLKLGALASTNIEEARRFWMLRYWGAFAAVKYGCPGIRSGGSIVLTSGLAGRRPHGGWTVASSICGAMEGLTRALAVELAPIRVNAVCPGVVKTPLWDSMSEADRTALYRQMNENLLVRHVGESEEVAEAYLYLLRQTYGTGQSIVVDGGGALV
jgi:NAD(P)-dependent dehydrogenase (short-subunit alcohol dehydrogenase family)